MPSTPFMALLSGDVTPETERLGVYALSLIVGLVVSGLITIAKDTRSQKIHARHQSALARVRAFM